MKRLLLATISILLLGAGACRADFIVSAPDGRRVLLKDDGTWAYQDATAKGKVEQGQPEAAAVLRLEKKLDRGTGCRLVFSLTNALPYEISSIVPILSAYRPNGVLHESLSVAFLSVRASDMREASADFSRITCQDIARVKVGGGDRCVMGELHKFSDAAGQCLARVRLAPSDLLLFEK